MNVAFQLRAVRLINLGLRRVFPGDTVSLDARTAADLIHAGRAVLVDPNRLADLARQVRESDHSNLPVSELTRSPPRNSERRS